MNIGRFAEKRPRTDAVPSQKGQENVTLQAECPGGEIGRRNGLKIRYPHGCVGSIPTPGTNKTLGLREKAPLSVPLDRIAGVTIV